MEPKTKNARGVFKTSTSKDGLFFQPKLTLNQSNDVYEKEADAVADAVVSSNNFSTNPSFFSPVSKTFQRKCKECEEEEKMMQRKETANATLSNIPTNYITNLSGGSPLPQNDRNFFESKIGYDFGNVRLHTDAAANESAKNINALAYTHGNHIVFGANQYQPETDAGKKLLAHELVHVIQQNSAAGTQLIQRQPEQSQGKCYTCEIPGGIGVCCYSADAPFVQECFEVGKAIIDNCKGKPESCLQQAQCASCKCIAQVRGEQYCRCTGIV